jgi:hypothetical protein
LTGALRQTANQRRTEPCPIEAKHYFAKTTTRINVFYICLYILSILTSLFYFVIRVVYIAQGRGSVEIPLNVAVEDPITGQERLVGELLPDLAIGGKITDDMLSRPALASVKRIIDEDTYSYWWSCCVLAAEIGGFILVHLSQQMFVRQDTKFYEMPPDRVAQLRNVCSLPCKVACQD